MLTLLAIKDRSKKILATIYGLCIRIFKKMKNVLVDFSHYDDFCGFGEIARNFAPRLAAADVPDLHFIFVLPRERRGLFGDKVEYIDRDKKKQISHIYDKPLHLWHATDQQYNYRLRRKGLLQLLTVHDLNFLHEKSGLHRLRHILQLRHRVMHSDCVTTISNYVRDELLSFMKGYDKPVPVIYNGITDLSLIEPCQPSFVSRSSEPFLLALGQVREKKNFQLLVPMMHYLPDYRLYICGDDHFDYADSLRKLISEKGEGRVSLVGKISDAEKVWLYSHCAAFMFPSRLEGFGIPVLEAMRFHCKVFSSRLSSLPEVCGSHAFYWDSFEPSKMAEVVKRGLSSWTARMGDDAARYSESFNYEKYTDCYIRLYRQMLSMD